MSLNMSLSVDDLVSSFSSSHIGQEAIDLAALQAQLAQTLFASARQIPNRNSHTCNTPVARTPSSSFSFPRPTDEVTMDDDDDERMVEELIMPSSPIPASQSTSSTHSQAHLSSYFPLSVEPSSSSASVFTSTDPFYLATMQQQQQQSASTSFFAQNGRLAQNSPFFARQVAKQHQHQHRENHHHSLTVDTSHSIFASAAY